MTAFVEEALDGYVEALEEERLPDGHWHPSSLFGCARRAVYDFIGAEKAPLTKKSKRIFRMGHIIHELIQTALQRSPKIVRFYPEVSVSDPELNTKGHADGLALLDDGTWVVCEFKSISGFGFKALKGPKDDHLKQAKTYVRSLRKFGGHVRVTPEWLEANYSDDLELDTDAEGMMVVIPPLGALTKIGFAYLSKDSLDILEYEEVFTDADDAWLVEYLERLSLHVFEGTLPRRLVNITPTGRVSKTRAWECNWCPFAERCWNPREPEGVE